MTILMVNKFHYLRGGAERYVFDLTELLERQGHRVIPFATRHPANVPSEFDSDFIPAPDFDAPAGGGAALRTAGRVIYSPSARRAIKQALVRHRPDLVHLHNIAHHFSPSILDALAEAGVPVVQTVHDYKLVCPTYLMLCHGEICERCARGNVGHAILQRCNRGSLLRSAVSAVESYLAAARDAYAPVRRFLCPSDFLLRKLAARGIAPERLVHLPLFVDPARFGEGAEPVPSAYAIFVGRLSAEKGLMTLLAAAKAAREVPLVIAGDGPLAPELARAVREPGLEHVTLAGRLTGEALVERWRAARFTLVPSEWYENFPLAIAESFALGKPVIGTRLGGVAELIGADEARGRLVPPADPAALAAAMRALWAAPDEARALGRAARAEVTRRFTPEAHWAGLRRAYADAGAPIGAGGL